MCDTDAPGPAVYRDGWVRARKPHRCTVCDETIRRGDLYHKADGLWEGDWGHYKHCARCWRLFEALNAQAPGQIPLGLDCGEVYEGPPDDSWHLMAFMTRNDAQRYAQRVVERERSIDPLPQKAESYARYGNPVAHRVKWRGLVDASPDDRLREVIKEEGNSR